MDRRAHKALLTALIGLGLLDEAERALGEWAALDRSNPEVHLLAGDLLKLQGDLVAALRAYSSILDLRPENPRMLAALAQYYEARGEWQAAHPFRISLATLKPKDSSAKVDLAVTALKAGRSDDALRATNQLVDGDRSGYATFRGGVTLSKADRDTVFSIRSSQSLPLLFGSSLAADLRSAGLRVTMTWDRPANLDLWMSTSRDSYVGGTLGKSRLLTNASGQEKIFFVAGQAMGRYRAQVLCRDGRGCDGVTGRLLIESHGERRTLPFALSGTRGRDLAAIRIEQTWGRWSVK
jgi:tetratricopeptide (TPR) repeat protein